MEQFPFPLNWVTNEHRQKKEVMYDNTWRRIHRGSMLAGRFPTHLKIYSHHIDEKGTVRCYMFWYLYQEVMRGGDVFVVCSSKIS